MIRALILLAMLFTFLGQGSVAGVAPSRPARSKSEREARAKAKLNRIRPLIGAGKYKTARRRLRKLIRDYPGTIAALEAGIILGTLSARQE